MTTDLLISTASRAGEGLPGRAGRPPSPGRRSPSCPGPGGWWTVRGARRAPGGRSPSCICLPPSPPGEGREHSGVKGWLWSRVHVTPYVFADPPCVHRQGLTWASQRFCWGDTAASLHHIATAWKRLCCRCVAWTRDHNQPFTPGRLLTLFT